MSRKIPPPGLDAGSFCFGIQPNWLNVYLGSESDFPRAKSLGSSARTKPRRTFFFSWFHFTVVTAPSFSETTSRIIVHGMSGNAWSYLRHVAYGFLRLSKGA
jgi:hypothetical protein